MQTAIHSRLVWQGSRTKKHHHNQFKTASCPVTQLTRHRMVSVSSVLCGENIAVPVTALAVSVTAVKKPGFLLTLRVSSQARANVWRHNIRASVMTAGDVFFSFFFLDSVPAGWPIFAYPFRWQCAISVQTDVCVCVCVCVCCLLYTSDAADER